MHAIREFAATAGLTGYLGDTGLDVLEGRRTPSNSGDQFGSGDSDAESFAPEASFIPLTHELQKLEEQRQSWLQESSRAAAEREAELSELQRMAGVEVTALQMSAASADRERRRESLRVKAEAKAEREKVVRELTQNLTQKSDARVERASHDHEKAILEFQHKLNMQQMKHDRHLEELHAQQEEREAALRQKVRRRDAAIKEVISERDALKARLQEERAENARLTEHLQAAQKVGKSRGKEIASLTSQMELRASQSQAEAQALEARLASVNEKREELSKRCEITDRLVNELRGKLESSLLRAQKAEQSFHAGLEALQEARRETVEATTRHELMVERVTMLQREGERREESLREALATVRQKEDELREVVGALSAAREQRNQAAREAEACRVSAAEANDDVQRSAELVAASDARVANTERRLVQEGIGRQRAESQLEDVAVAHRAERSKRQRRMLVVFLRTGAMLRAIGSYTPCLNQSR